MNRTSPNNTRFQLASCLFMILSLLWLTISTPYVNAAQQVKQEMGKKSIDNNNPFSNTTEEKNESSVNSLSEYLHNYSQEEVPPVMITKFYKCHSSDVYFAFHPELISPPPEGRA